MGKTLTSTGNFYARPNASPDIGFTIEYHFHEFSHTVIPMAGLWRVRQYTYVEGDVSPNEANFLSEILIGPDNYHPPETQVERWALIEKNRWHSLTLISKTVYLSHAQMVLVPEQQVTVPAGTQFVMEDGLLHTTQADNTITIPAREVMMPAGTEIETAEGEFWCCFSLRDYTGSVVEYYTGWQDMFR